MFEHPPQESERASWTWFFLGSLVILLTIPLARAIQGLVENTWGRGTFTVVVIACVIATLGLCVHRLARHPARFTPGRTLWLVAVAAAYTAWAVALGQGSPEEAVHFLEYGGLSLLAFRALGHRFPDRGIYLAATLLSALVGTLDEIVQWLIPDRYWDFGDVALNATSAGLMQVALWRGIVPAFLGKGVGAPTLRLIRRLGTAQLVLLGLCASNTPPRMAWMARHVPFLHGLLASDDMMMEYGHRYVDPEIGVFFSRLAPEDLRQTDAGHGEAAARVLDAYRDEARYPEFLRRFSPAAAPFVHEARVHLFRRDRFISRALEPGADLEFQRQHCTVAWRENRILEKYFPHTLRASSYVLSSERAAFVASHHDPAERYVSRVSDTLVCRIREWQIWAVTLLLIAGLQWLGRRDRREAALLVRPAGPTAQAG